MEERYMGEFIENTVTWIIICVGLPLNIAAICSTCCLVRKDRVAMIYVINLLMSNIIQLCSMIGIVTVQDRWLHEFFCYVHVFGLMSCLGFLVCISLERYLIITSPRCSCLKKAIQIYEVVCLMVWVIPLSLVLRVHSFPYIIFAIITLLLLPFPLFIFLLAGSLKALCATSSAPPDEKRRTVAILVLVLLVYILLILPYLIGLLPTNHLLDTVISHTFIIVSRLIPLANVGVYFFLRKGAADKCLSSVCCCRMDNSEISSRVNDDTVSSV